ncbi:LB_137 family protein [Leptospira adleri]|uniref:Uncharacterized protein n=1 Tax=Leptospira adleri TaxID=2023186 RepID=A0A2M9YKQ9_9LEPT|nr:hypothetical protein [Leptospira adleri]PJZ52125.1 hypothetical protein CH380_16980 [Leptospira adleri]PJZ59927.1 hypothetical protein CH376_21120 [Leptospira adleri]
MNQIFAFVALIFFLSMQIEAHRVVLKTGEIVTGQWKDSDGQTDHIVIITDGAERKIEKREILELFFEETGNGLCFTSKKESEKKCGLKLLKLNSLTVYYMDETNRYLRIPLQDLKDFTIEAPSSKIFEQLSQLDLPVRIVSERNRNFLSKIERIDGESIFIREESSEAPIEILKKEIQTLTCVLNETSKKDSDENSKNLTSITFIDYLIPGYYLKKQGHLKSGYSLMGLTAFFAAGAVHEFIAAKKSKSEQPTLIPQDNGSFLWFESENNGFQKHKQLNHIFLLSLTINYILNTTLLAFPITYELLFHETERPLLDPSTGKDQKIEMKININF